MENICKKPMSYPFRFRGKEVTYNIDDRVEIDEEHDSWDEIGDKGNHEEHDSLIPEHPPQTRPTGRKGETGKGDDEHGKIGKHCVEIDEREIGAGDGVDGAGIDGGLPVRTHSRHTMHQDAPES